MAYIEWVPEMSVGVDALDNDHKNLVATINKLHEALADGWVETATAEILDSIVQTSIEHFSREEALFSKTEYPDIELHRRLHKECIQQLLSIKDRFTVHPSKEISQEFLFFIKKQFIEHFQVFDQQFIPYLEEKGLATPRARLC